MATVTIQQRVKAMYMPEYNRLKNGIDGALTSIPMDRDGKVTCAIQMEIPADLWYVLVQEVAESNWIMEKESKDHDVHEISLSYKWMQ